LIRKSEDSANSCDVDREDEEEGCGERNTEAFLFGDGLQIFRLIDPVWVFGGVCGGWFHRRQLCGIFWNHANRTP
jgi:hypothetical protein